MAADMRSEFDRTDPRGRPGRRERSRAIPADMTDPASSALEAGSELMELCRITRSRLMRVIREWLRDARWRSLLSHRE